VPRSDSSSRGVALSAAAMFVAVIAVAALAIGVFRWLPPTAGAPRPLPTVEPSPIATPKPSPSATPRPSATPVPSDPIDGPVPMPIDDPLGHDVRIIVDDESGVLVGVRSGRAGDGMSVRWYDVKVENVDSDTLRVTWVGLPGDGVIGLGVSMRDDGKLRLRFVQPLPRPNTDAMGVDRVLILDFEDDIRANDVLASIQEGLDTDD
jgi:hypothetical protein